MNQKNLSELGKQIEEAKRKLVELKRQDREETRAEKRENRKPPGRKQLPTGLIERAKETAKTKTLTDTALSLGISLRSLYNKGISRKAIDAENANKIAGISAEKPQKLRTEGA